MGPLAVLGKVTHKAIDKTTAMVDAERKDAEQKKAMEGIVDAFREHIEEKLDLKTYGVDSETVDELRAMEGGEEILGRMAERRERDREESLEGVERRSVVGPMLNSPTKEELDQRRADNRSQSEYGVDADIADMIRGLDGGNELLGRMAERQDAKREAAADKLLGGKLPKLGYVGGATTGIGDALDAVDNDAGNGVSDMLEQVADFAKSRVESVKETVASVAQTGVEDTSQMNDINMDL